MNLDVQPHLSGKGDIGTAVTLWQTLPTQKSFGLRNKKGMKEVLLMLWVTLDGE